MGEQKHIDKLLKNNNDEDEIDTKQGILKETEKVLSMIV